METKQTEIKQPEANKPQAKKPGKNPLNSTRFKRGGMATLLTVVFIAIVVVLNIVVSALTERFRCCMLSVLSICVFPSLRLFAARRRSRHYPKDSQRACHAPKRRRRACFGTRL